MTRSFAVLVGCAALIAGAAFAAPRIWKVERERVAIELRAMTPGVLASGKLLLTDESPQAETSLQIAWPPGRPARPVLVRARLGSRAGSARMVLLETEIPGNGSPVRSATRISVDEVATGLVEAARAGDSVLTLAASLERTVTQEATAHPPVGRPVRFLVEVQHVNEGTVTSLETNRLQTFVGRTVGYEFRLGQPGTAASARLRLTPVELREELLVIDVQVDGTLPGESAPEVVAWREERVSSRNATSTLALESGDPPSGYRLLVTPEF